jgi:LPXTG-site transpeptidase (sortase) family protein
MLTVVGLGLTAVGLGRMSNLPSLTDLISSWYARGGPGAPMNRSVPARIAIPALGLSADTVEVGKASDGSIATPDSNPQRAGWYRLGPTPGEAGTAVIVGHVDTANKPAVFAQLNKLKRGKMIEVHRSDRRVATFAVDTVETLPKSSFPADRIFTHDGPPRLVLVTCGGPWIGGHEGYADNIIVWATLK